MFRLGRTQKRRGRVNEIRKTAYNIGRVGELRSWFLLPGNGLAAMVAASAGGQLALSAVQRSGVGDSLNLLSLDYGRKSHNSSFQAPLRVVSYRRKIVPDAIAATVFCTSRAKVYLLGSRVSLTRFLTAGSELGPP